MIKTARKVTLLSVLFVAGCTSTGGVTQIGRDTYTVGTVSRGGFTGWQEVKARSYQAAADHCAKQGKIPEEADMTTRGVRSWTPMEADLTFRCVEP
jgi:hypothetical protein